MPQYATEHINRREIDTRAMTTAQWDMVDAQIRERAFFMAGVENARILQDFRNAAHAIAAGQLTTNEARKQLRAALRAAGYEPAEDERGGIHDLSSRRRMEVTLQTNVDLARGWQQREQMKKDKSQPGLRLYRAQEARQPRNWADRWQQAAAAVDWEGVAKGGQMVALIESPIWVELSRFGQPYPPFDFGSKMRVRAVPYEECEKLGLVPGEKSDRLTVEAEKEEKKPEEKAPEQAEEIEVATPELSAERLEDALEGIGTKARRKLTEAARTSLNDHLEADVSHLDDKVVEAMREQMGALVEVRDGKIISTDLNGTRPYTPQELADIWAKGLPKWVTKKQPGGGSFTNLQKEALVEWVRTNDAFDKRPEKGTVSETMRQSFRDFLQRLKSEESTEPLYRGMGWDDIGEMEKMRDICRRNGETYSPAPWKEADSFTSSESMAKLYAEKQGKKRGEEKKYQAILKVIGHHSAKDMRPLYEVISTVQQDPVTPTHLEAELFFIAGTRFEVVSVQRYDLPNGGKRDVYTLREL